TEGAFQAAPTVEVYDGVDWHAVAATWEPPYAATSGHGIWSYVVTLQSSAIGARGVRLIGNPSGSDDGDGWIGVSEMAVYGQPAFPQPLDFSVDLARQAGVEGFSTSGFTQF